MSRVATIAWREFRLTVFRPIFIIAVLGIPVGLVGVMALAVALTVQSEKNQPPLIGTVAIAAPTPEVAEAVQLEFGEEQLRRDTAEQIEAAQQRIEKQVESGPGMGNVSDLAAAPPTIARGDIRVDVEPVSVDDASAVDALTERVRQGDLLAAAIIEPAVLAVPDADRKNRPSFVLHVGENLDSDHVALIERRVGQAVVRVRAAMENLDPDRMLAMLRRPEARTTRALATGEEAAEGEGQRVLRLMLPMLFMALLWVSTFTAGQHLLTSTIEEKSNRVMEVLLSAVSPLQLVTGKILGHGAVGLLIALFYSSVVVAGFIVGAMLEPSFRRIIEPMHLVYLTLLFFMAYFMVASLMAAVGSAVSDIREANTLVTPVMLIMMVPWMLWMPISQAPNGSIATAFSFIPPASPFAMIARLAAEEPVPTWQIIAALAWGYVCTVAMVWLAAKIFRVGVLMYGKPPSPIELIKWARYS
jgi:ABC-2 type transport system permease protein